MKTKDHVKSIKQLVELRALDSTKARIMRCIVPSLFFILGAIAAHSLGGDAKAMYYLIVIFIATMVGLVESKIRQQLEIQNDIIERLLNDSADQSNPDQD